MPLNDARTHTVLSDLGRLEAEPEGKNRVAGDGGDGPDGEVKAAVSGASDPETEAETGAETEAGAENEVGAGDVAGNVAETVPVVNGGGGRGDAEGDMAADSTVPISAVMAAAASGSSAARTMPMPRIGGNVASPTMKMPRVSADDAARTVPIPKVGAGSGDVIGNAVRDAAAEAMTMKMPAVVDGGGFVEAPTEPLPVLREGDSGEGDVNGGRSSEGDLGGGGSSGGDDSEAGPFGGGDREAGPFGGGDAEAGEDSEAIGGGDTAELAKPAALAEAATVSFRRVASTEIVLPETVAEVVAVVDAASKAIAAAEDAARQVAEAHAKPVVEDAPPPVLDLRQPAQPAPVDGVLELLAPVLNRPLLEVEEPAMPPAADLMALHRAEFEVEFTEPPYVAAGDEPAIPTRFGPGLAVLPHIEFPV